MQASPYGDDTTRGFKPGGGYGGRSPASTAHIRRNGALRAEETGLTYMIM